MAHIKAHKSPFNAFNVLSKNNYPVRKIDKNKL